MSVEGQSLNAIHRLHNSLTPFSNTTTDVLGEYNKSEYHNSNQEEGEVTTTGMTRGRGEPTPRLTTKRR